MFAIESIKALGEAVKQCAKCLEYQCTQPWETTLHYEIP